MKCNAFIYTVFIHVLAQRLYFQVFLRVIINTYIIIIYNPSVAYEHGIEQTLSSSSGRRIMMLYDRGIVFSQSAWIPIQALQALEN